MATVASPASAKPFGALHANAMMLLPPLVICGGTAVFASSVAQMAGISAWPLLSYFEMAKVTLLCTLVLGAWTFARAAAVRSDEPVGKLAGRLLERAPLLLMPALLLPAFLVGYTTSKTAIPLVVGYTWDSFWANADRLILGNDAWRVSRAVFGSGSSWFWSYWYAVVWGTAFLLSTNGVALLARRSFVGVFFTAMMGAWLIGGCFMAYAFSAAGPVFAPIFDPSLTERFGPLQQVLKQTLGQGSIGLAQDYLLEAARQTHVAEKGGGISAMPSMHIATVTIYVLAARGTKWLLPAIVFWVSIFIGSAYFGFHYWVDGIAGAAIAALCWRGAQAVYARLDAVATARMEALPASACEVS
jgi:membrane-associated phospholipid phosphatase